MPKLNEVEGTILSECVSLGLSGTEVGSGSFSVRFSYVFCCENGAKAVKIVVFCSWWLATSSKTYEPYTFLKATSHTFQERLESIGLRGSWASQSVGRSKVTTSGELSHKRLSPTSDMDEAPT